MIQEALGGTATTPYPDDRFDIMWIMRHHKIVSKESEKCKGIDDGRTVRYDPDLELDDEWDNVDEEGVHVEGEDFDDELDGDFVEPAAEVEVDADGGADMDGLEALAMDTTDDLRSELDSELEQGQLILGN